MISAPVSPQERLAIRGGLLALVMIKLAVIAVYGPLVQPDTGGYVTYADQILRDTDWLLHQPGGGGDASYRMVGYPLLVAISKIILGEGFGYGMLAVQSLLGIAAACALYGFFRRLFGHWAWAYFAAGCYATSQALVFDAFILTDGMYGSIIAMTAALVGWAACDRDRKLWPVCVSGILLCAAFLIREATLLLALTFMPLVFLAASKDCRTPAAFIRVFAVFLLPLLCVAAGYVAWNQLRSDAPFVTTGMRTAALFPLVRIAGTGVPVFDGQGPLDEAARATLRHYSYDEVLAINRAMESKGMTGYEIDREARAKYWRSLFRFPMEFLGYALSETGLERRAVSLANPVRSVAHLEEFRADGQLGGFRSRMRRAFEGGHYWLGAVALVEVLFSAAAIGLGVLAYAVFPLRYLAALVSKAPMPEKWHVLGAAWALYFGFLGAYSMIRMEDRYLIGVAPMALLVGLAMAEDIANALRARRSKTSPGHG